MNQKRAGLTVAELIALLQQQPQDLQVHVEGCDCYGAAGSLSQYHPYWDETQTIVLIERTVESFSGL